MADSGESVVAPYVIIHVHRDCITASEYIRDMAPVCRVWTLAICVLIDYLLYGDGNLVTISDQRCVRRC